MKKKYLLMFLVLLLCIGCNKKVEEGINTDKLLLEAINGTKKIVYEDGSTIYFDDIKFNEDENAVPSEYVLIDLDKDGTKELVCLTTAFTGEYVILRYNKTNNSIYGYHTGYRSFMDLKEDGSFRGSGGASITGYYILKFDNNMMSAEEVALLDYSENKYTINNQNVTKEEAVNYETEFNKKKGVTWIKIKE